MKELWKRTRTSQGFFKSVGVSDRPVSMYFKVTLSLVLKLCIFTDVLGWGCTEEEVALKLEVNVEIVEASEASSRALKSRLNIGYKTSHFVLHHCHELKVLNIE